MSTPIRKAAEAITARWGLDVEVDDGGRESPASLTVSFGTWSLGVEVTIWSGGDAFQAQTRDRGGDGYGAAGLEDADPCRLLLRTLATDRTSALHFAAALDDALGELTATDGQPVTP